MSEDLSKSSPDKTASTMEGSNRRRSERVVLRIPVGLSAIMPDGQRICIEAHTLVVNAHGGLLDAGVEMAREQRIQLSNSKTIIATAGRVLRVEGSEEGRFLIAFEFESPAPHFWPVSFPPADWSNVESRV